MPSILLCINIWGKLLLDCRVLLETIIPAHRQPAQGKPPLQSQFTLRHPEGRHQSFLSLADETLLSGEGLPVRAEFSVPQDEIGRQDDVVPEAQLLVARARQLRSLSTSGTIAG